MSPTDNREREMDASVAAIGHNQPPEPTPFEKISEEIESLYGEAKLWLDGDPIATQGQADGVGKLLNLIRDVAKRADLARIAENKPFDDGKAEVQRRYAALIADTKSMKGKTTLAMDACKKALAPWLDKLDREKKAEAERLRLEAEEKAHIAQEAIRASSADNLVEREAAEALLKDSKKADAAANRAAKDTAKASGGVGKAVSLRSTWHASITDDVAFVRYVWARHHSEISAFLTELANRLAREGKRDIPGCEIHEERKAV